VWCRKVELGEGLVVGREDLDDQDGGVVPDAEEPEQQAAVGDAKVTGAAEVEGRRARQATPPRHRLEQHAELELHGPLPAVRVGCHDVPALPHLVTTVLAEVVAPLEPGLQLGRARSAEDGRHRCSCHVVDGRGVRSSRPQRRPQRSVVHIGLLIPPGVVMMATQ
jgi:hypothetical protein